MSQKQSLPQQLPDWRRIVAAAVDSDAPNALTGAEKKQLLVWLRTGLSPSANARSSSEEGQRYIEGLKQPVGFDLSRKEVLAMKIPPKVWIASQGKKGLFRRPDLVNFHGMPFSGKTELLKAAAIPLTQGGDFFGYEVTEPGGIFWANLDTEWDDTQEMYQAWPKKVGDMIHATDLHPADLKGGFKEWLDRFEASQDKWKWTMCVIDTMAQLIRKGPQGQSIDEFKRDQVTEFLTPLRRKMNERRVMGIILNHPRKPQMGDTQIEMPSTGSYGSVAFGAMVDLTMRLRKYASGDLVLDWQGRRRPDGRIDLHWNDETLKFEQRDAPIKVALVTKADEDILNALRGSDQPMTGRELADAIGKKSNYVTQRLALLRENGKVVPIGNRGTAATYALGRTPAGNR